MISSALVEIVQRHRALADADRLGEADALVASWHMFEQSGKLLLPYSRAKSWNR
jgi:hypothetical protein